MKSLHLSACKILGLLALAGATGPAPTANAASGLQQRDGGLQGYISMNIPVPPEGFGTGVSFYSTAWPLLEKPLAGFQMGLPSIWIVPDNRTVKEPLLPVGTYARDHWTSTSYQDVFETIEGGLGFWNSTRFGSATAKFRINGIPDGYNHQISSPGWGFGDVNSTEPAWMGLVQLSNRLIIPPDGLTFKKGTSGELLGYGWMALPLTLPVPKAGPDSVPVGDQSWTVFLNAANFKGPLAFWAPSFWTKIARGYLPAEGRTLDVRPAIINGGAIEIGSVPLLTASANDQTYSRIPRLQFPVDADGRTVLMQDFTFYSRAALADRIAAWIDTGRPTSGTFDLKASFIPACSTNPISLRQGDAHENLVGFDDIVQTTMLGKASFGLTWKTARTVGYFPDYFQKQDKTWVALPSVQVPASTGLKDYVFAPAETQYAYTSPTDPNSSWQPSEKASATFYATLTDGSVIAYRWYRFIDQPSVRSLALDAATLQRLQKLAELVHQSWDINDQYLPPPSRGTIATLDPALLVTPPAGMEKGYVPIVLKQAYP